MLDLCCRSACQRCCLAGSESSPAMCNGKHRVTTAVLLKRFRKGAGAYLDAGSIYVSSLMLGPEVPGRSWVWAGRKRFAASVLT